MAEALVSAQPLRRRWIDWRVWCLNFGLGLVAAALSAEAIGVGPKVTQYALHWWVLAVLFFAAEVYVVQLRFRGDPHAVSLGEFPLVLGMFFATPIGLLAGRLVGTAAALLCRRQRPARIAYALMRVLAATSIAVIVFHGASHFGSGMTRIWLGALLGTCAASFIDSLADLAMSVVAEGQLQIAHLPRMLSFRLGITLTNSTVGLMGIVMMQSDWPAVWLLLVPTAVLLVAYRAYAAERQKHERIQFLYESGRVMQQSGDPEAAMLALLRHAAEMFRAESAELVLLALSDQEEPLRTAVRGGAAVEVMAPVDRALPPALALALGAPPEPRLVANTRHHAELADYFAARGLRNAMLAPLQTEVRLAGMIVVGNRIGDTGRFDADDLRLLGTLAAHASASIENARLEAKLKHQAFHDSLTQLANRALFTDRVEHALARRIEERNLLAVIFLDLDDFKTINDSLGHIAGDQLLVAVAERLRACLRPQDTAARLGGDEFAILLEDVDHIDYATRVAARIVEAFRSPFMVQREEVVTHASIGIAATRSEHARADDLLRQADEAMYNAKAQGKGRYEVFEPKMHVAVVERHELKADLQRRDFGTQTFSIYYQPIVRLENGEIVGIEALLRWQHPRRGLVSPNDFIGIAEETGLILPLGKWVLQKAARQVRKWQEKYPEHAGMGVSVNLSARQLQNPGLLEDIMEVLGQSDLEPNQLVLEITESVMIQDIDASVERLRQLKQLGVRLAIDDFGTGYSSLGILQQVPADTIKIAKQFVDGIGQDETREHFAKAIVQLGQTVHMSVVAEGIESVRQAERLAELGCQYGQGFLFSEPLKAVQIDEQLGRAVSFGTSFGRTPVPAVEGDVIPLPKPDARAREAV